MIGNQAAQILFRGEIRTKLAINQPADSFEQEADRVAERVIQSPRIQRTCAECEEELYRKAGADDRALSSPGRPLPDSERRFFEPRFGRDFSQVRVLTGPEAGEAARSLHALAYTTRNQIVFAEGQYCPGTYSGRSLLAHELAHVVQQQEGSTVPSVQRQQRPPRVTLTTTGQCPNARRIAEAIPGAWAMANTALSWFLSFTSPNRARVNLLLKANFLSDSDDTRDVVKNRIVRIRELLAAAQNGNLTFDCVPRTDRTCGARPGYVRAGERGIVHLCPQFFNETLEQRRWTLTHESAHLAGAMLGPEDYYGFFGPVSESNCRALAPQSSTRDALDMADNYARLIWCLTKPPETEITPP